MTVIDRIETIPFRIPLTSPVAFATGLLEAAEHVLVRVVDSDGAVGLAEPEAVLGEAHEHAVGDHAAIAVTGELI